MHASMDESRRYLLVFPLGVTERHHISRHAFVAVWIIAALHFPGTKGASVVVNGDVGPVCTGIYTNLFCLYGLACGQAAGGHPRLFQNAIPEFLHMAQADANARVICPCGGRCCHKNGCYE